MGKIQDDSYLYTIVYNIVKFAFKKFFRQIEIHGKENIPKNEPVIFAPNHQSGLMDPLSVVLNQEEPIVFLTRADIFNGKLFNGLFRFFKMMPVYRIRDGYETLSKNEDQFNIARDVLVDKKKLCVMPEGNHGNQHKLRPLVKGLFRIAFSTEELLDNKAHVRIVPVSLDYNFFQHAGADLIVRFGKPIKVEDYFTLYLENQANAFNILRNDLSENLSEMMHNIRSTANYDLIYNLCCYLTPTFLKNTVNNSDDIFKTRAGKNFFARKTIGKKLDELENDKYEYLIQFEALTKDINKLPGYPSERTDLLEFKPDMYTCFINLILSLISLPGTLMNLPALIISRFFFKKIKDKQMHNTYAFVVGLILFPIVYLIISIIIATALGYGFVKALILILIVTTIGIIGERLRQFLRIPFRHLIYSFGKRKRMLLNARKDYEILKQLFKKII